MNNKKEQHGRYGRPGRAADSDHAKRRHLSPVPLQVAKCKVGDLQIVAVGPLNALFNT